MGSQGRLPGRSEKEQRSEGQVEASQAKGRRGEGIPGRVSSVNKGPKLGVAVEGPGMAS